MSLLPGNFAPHSRRRTLPLRHIHMGRQVGISEFLVAFPYVLGPMSGFRKRSRDGVVNPLLARNWPPPSFRRKPESIFKRNNNTPAFHIPVIVWNQSEKKKQRQNKWIPAFAGMTKKPHRHARIGRVLSLRPFFPGWFHAPNHGIKDFSISLERGRRCANMLRPRHPARDW